MFRLLGRHPDLAIPAVAALIGTTTALARGLLDQLVRAHLAQEIGPGEFGMHNLLRAYATEPALAGLPGRGQATPVSPEYPGSTGVHLMR